MTRTVKRGTRTGSVDIISSKSYAHRLIILASLAKSAKQYRVPRHIKGY